MSDFGLFLLHFNIPGDGEGDGFMACLQEIAGLYKEMDATVTRAKKDIAVELAREVDLYLQISLLRQDNCYLQYWKHEEKFPLLKQMAAVYLCTPAPSVYSGHGKSLEEKSNKDAAR